MVASPKDHLGSVKVIVNASGARVAHNDFYPFGMLMPGRMQEASSVDGRYKFTGKERDTETNYDYFGARYYDARIGRWLQVDPLASERPGLNPYHYVQNSPINRFDPYGYVDMKRVGIGALGVLSGSFVTALGCGIIVGTGVTVAGALGGTALMMHGMATIGFGFAEIIAGFTESAQEVPGGPLEVVGMAVKEATGLEGAAEVGKVADLGVQVISGGNPVKNLQTAGKTIPTSAREATQAGTYQVKVAKELTNVASQTSSTVQLGQIVKDHVKNEADRDKDIPND